MADNSSGGPFGHDPLGDRIRDTFQAERADIERRLHAHDAPSARSRSVSWIPFAAAAAVLAIAGFLFIGNRGTDTSVELDVAGQVSQVGGESTVDQAGQPGDAATSLVPPPSMPTPAGLPESAMPNVIPFLTGGWFCGDAFDPELAVVWRADNSNSPALEIPGFQVGVTREILSGTAVEPVGGCTAGTTGLGYGQWHEIRSLSGQNSEWILRDYLITASDYQAWVRDGTPPTPAPTQPPNIGQAQPVPDPSMPGPPDFPPPTAFDPNNECGAVLVPALFVWNIAVDDPDGGLVAHTEIGVDAPVTRVLELDQVVTPTGACFLSESGSPWREIIAPDGSTDWVSARYLNDQVAPACLEGERFGSRTRDGVDPQIHVIAAGDTLAAIAERYNIALPDLLTANPQLDPSAIRIGEQMQIPATVQIDPTPEQVFGPLDGLAISDGDRTAFASTNSLVYRWYDSDAIVIGRSCFGDALTGPACAYGEIALTDPRSPEAIWSGVGPIDITSMGRTLPGQSSDSVRYAVSLATNGAEYHGYIDSFDTRIEFAPCAAGEQADDSFAIAPCNATDSDVVTGSTTRGSTNSTADHVLNLRSEQGASPQGPCTRIVIEFGTVGSDGERVSAALLPPMTIEKSPELTRIVLPSWAGHPEQLTRLEASRATALIATLPGGISAVDVLHHDPSPVNVWFLENPARVIVDYLQPPPAFDLNKPVGALMVTRSSIHGQPLGPGVLEGTPIVVNGYGRPFEAQGLLRLYAIDPSDATSSIGSYWPTAPEPIYEVPLATSGWIDGWGTFQVTLPELLPGNYVAVFGELSASDDEPGFIGVAEIFRVYDPRDPDAAGVTGDRIPIIEIPAPTN